MIKEPGLVYIEPVRRDGTYLGFVASVVQLSNLSRFIETISDSSDVHAFIVTGGNRVLAHQNFTQAVPELDVHDPLPDISQVNDPHMALFSLPDEFTIGTSEAESSADARGRVVRKDDLAAAFFYRNVVGFGPEVWTFGIYTPLANIRRS